MESDVASTLGELERKLKELERELESVGRSGEADADPAQAGWTQPAEPPAPPAGTTPFTASWHGGSSSAAPPPPPPPSYNGAPAAVPVPPPPSPFAPAGAAPPVAPPAAAPDAGLHRQLDELLAFRERLVQSTNELVAELSRVLTDLGADVGAPPSPPDPHDQILAGALVVEAAPFTELATLAAFEQAIARTRGVAHVAVRTLDQGRATFDVTLGEPVAFGAALRETAPVPFDLAVAGEGVVTLTLPPPEGAPPG